MWENGTVSEWVSHNNEERTIKLIQKIRRHLLITVECHWTLPHKITHDNARLHGFNFTHGGICLQIKWQPRFPTHFYLKTADSIQSLIFSKIYDHPNQIILNCWFCSAGQSTQLRQPRQPHGKENFKKAIWNFLCCLGLLRSKGLHFNGFTCVKRKRGTVWKHCVRVKKVECCSQAVTPTTKPQLK